MRPQHDAAENSDLCARGLNGLLASMRPQHDAAENNMGAPRCSRSLDASMRPQHDAAENAATETTAKAAVPRFNEAAA